MVYSSAFPRKAHYPPRLQGGKPPVITLLTDFGLEDVYVGVMKGIIAQIIPQAQVIDLSHEIPPQNIALGSFQLGTAYPHFPPGTIHVAVVDPGVGGTRRAIAVQTRSSLLVGPDNGLFSHVLMQDPAIAAVELTHSHYWYTVSPSSTFHGRDIFAPVAAHLATGCPLQNLGLGVDLSSLNLCSAIPPWQPTSTGGIGVIQTIDHFGNLITNIPAESVKNHAWSVQIGPCQIPSAPSYCSLENHPTWIALIGSHGWLEIALPNGNAQQSLQTHLGTSVHLMLHPSPPTL
ncbi:MAG: SAM-dependent chlorinase/fluorinase [Acaryochloris sp. RU_4_1]|nr:SAM-dependent chlorinase/fluorinase [Acaryochloris sp. RU_4_1]NJR55085.1 SAM-dependent chlorinase/fluorinase [Acaryochloris sp. CRU_2_0]